MAFTKHLKLDKTEEKLYYKILNLSEFENQVKITIGVFKNKEDAKDINNCIGNGEFFFTPDKSNNNLIKQAYEYLKKQPGFEEFSDA